MLHDQSLTITDGYHLDTTQNWLNDVQPANCLSGEIL